MSLPFLLHLLIETPAAVSFIFRPHKQLPRCSPAAVLILRQYGALLLATNLVCLVVLWEELQKEANANHPPPTQRRRLLSAALGTYHAWPIHRAVARLRRDVPGDDAAAASVLGGPLLHLVAHLLCLAAFLAAVFWNY